MRLLFLSKRRPQDRDLVTRPYGRFFNIPRELAARGHRVRLLLFDYTTAANDELHRQGMAITSIGVRQNPISAWRHVLDLARAEQPHWVIGFSDIWFGIMAALVAHRCGARYAVDAYDNYESYIPLAWPAHVAWRRAIAGCDLVTAAGAPLLEHMIRRGCRGATAVLPMAADDEFAPRDREECRLALGLPCAATLVGYAGSLHASRDTQLLLRLMRHCAAHAPQIRFVLSGRRLQSVDLPPNAMHLGYLADGKVPVLLNAMDAVLSLNHASTFGDHSYPAKIYEASACSVPCIAASTRATRWMAARGDLCLYEPGDLESLLSNLHSVLTGKRRSALKIARWTEVTTTLEALLQEICRGGR